MSVSAADGSNLMEVFSRVGRHSGSPRWAPDGQRIAFDSTAAGNFDVYAIQPGTAQPLRLTTESSDDVMPSWSPDGKWIYFASNESGQNDIWRIKPGGDLALTSVAPPSTGPAPNTPTAPPTAPAGK